MVGFFEGIDSERGIAWRLADSLTLRQFLSIGLDETNAGPCDDIANTAADWSGRRTIESLYGSWNGWRKVD